MPTGTVGAVSNEPTPAPADLAAFDDWARQASDSWQRGLVHEEVERRWADGSLDGDERALLAAWGAPVGVPPVPTLQAIAADPGIDRVLRARIQAAVAQATAESDPEGAAALVAEVLPVADDGALDVRTRLTLWLAVSEVYVRTGRPNDAMGVLNVAGRQVKDIADAPRWALPAIDVERLALAARSGQDREQLARSAHQIASVARQMPVEPTAVDVTLKAAGVLLSLGAAKPAENHFEGVIEATADLPGARGPRYQAQVGLAEALLRIEGPEAAIAVQREAIATVEPLGDSPMLGWAQRGLAVQLGAAERPREAAAAFSDAADIHDRLGLATDAAALRLEQAAALVQADDTAAATTLAESVAEVVAELPDPARTSLEMRLHQVFAQLASYEADLASAAEHWLEVAERAPKVGASPLDAQLTAAQLYAASGDVDEASILFARAELSAADAADPARATALVMRTHAETLRDVGRPGDAAELARVAANHARSSGDEAQAIYLSVIAADSLHEAGDSAAALQIYAETLQAAEGAEMPTLLGAVHSAHAKVLRSLGRDAEAAEAEASAALLSASREGSGKLPG